MIWVVLVVKRLWAWRLAEKKRLHRLLQWTWRRAFCQKQVLAVRLSFSRWWTNQNLDAAFLWPSDWEEGSGWREELAQHAGRLSFVLGFAADLPEMPAAPTRVS
jgi:hypothetical protein